jgi:predicted TIM-barrel fold metal-dependent hydrolase
MLNRNTVTFTSFAIVLFAVAINAQRSAIMPPIIDMHIHAELLSEFGGGELAVCTGDQKLVLPAIDPKKPFKPQDLVTCSKTIRASATDEKLLAETLAMFERYNIRRAVTAGPLELISKWHSAAPDRVIKALSFADRDISPNEYRKLYKETKFSVFAEVGMQYRGLSPADDRYEPYFALAEELDIPVAIHLGEGPPGGVHTLGPPTYRVKLGSPLLLEEVLVKHPKLRVYVMHYGSPLVDEMIAMLFSHPNLYVDIACNNWGFPRKQFYEHLRKMVDAGFEKRIMFGSDQMAWPGTIAKAIETVEQAPFLSRAQKRDIFYNNAARFLRLSEKDIADDHSMKNQPRANPRRAKSIITR